MTLKCIYQFSLCLTVVDLLLAAHGYFVESSMNPTTISWPKPDIDNTSASLLQLSDAPEAASCRGKCGQFQNLQCSCESRCVIFKNCCEDFPMTCMHILKESSKKFGHLLDLDIQCSYGKLMITNCSPRYNGARQSDQDRKRFMSLSILDLRSVDHHPVTDVTTGLVYRHMEIFRCNSDNQSVPIIWDLVIDGFIMNRINIFTEYTINKCKSKGFSFIEQKSTNRTIPSYQCLTQNETFLSSTRNEKTFYDLSHQPKVICLPFRTIFLNYEEADNYYHHNSTNCTPYVDITIWPVLFSQPAVVSYFADFVVLTLISSRHLTLWSSVRCDMNITNGSHCHECSVTCNSDLGFVKRGNSCLRLYYHYIAVPTIPILHELQNVASIPRFVNCMLKNELMLVTLDEWHPPRDLFAPVLNTTFYTMTFPIYMDEESLHYHNSFKLFIRYLPFLLRECRSRKAGAQHCPGFDSLTRSSEQTTSGDFIELEDTDWPFDILEETSCFQIIPELNISIRDGWYNFNKNIPALTCNPWVSLVKDHFSFKSILNSSDCFSVKSKSDFMSVYIHYISLCLFGLLTILINYNILI